MSRTQQQRPFTTLSPRTAMLSARALPETVAVEILDIGERGLTCYLLGGPLQESAAFFPWSAVDAIFWDVER